MTTHPLSHGSTEVGKTSACRSAYCRARPFPFASLHLRTSRSSRYRHSIYLQVDKEVWRVRDRKERWRLRTSDGQEGGPLKYEDAVSSLRRALHACVEADRPPTRAGNP